MHTDDVDNKYGTAVRYLYTICIWLSLKLQTSTCIIELCKVLWRCLWWLCTAPLSSGYNYLQLLYREIEEILLYQGFLRPILLTKHPECSEKELIEGTRGKVKFLISRISICIIVHNFIVYWVENAQFSEFVGLYLTEYCYSIQQCDPALP